MSGVLQERHELNREGLLRVCDCSKEAGTFSEFFWETVAFLTKSNEIIPSN